MHRSERKQISLLPTRQVEVRRWLVSFRELTVRSNTVKTSVEHQRRKCKDVVFWPFDPAKNAIPRWCIGRRWHILMAVMRGNRVGGNWLMKWDELKNSHGTLIDWCTGREWPMNCMAVISAWWRLNIRFQRSSGRSCGRWIII